MTLVLLIAGVFLYFLMTACIGARPASGAPVHVQGATRGEAAERGGEDSPLLRQNP